MLHTEYLELKNYDGPGSLLYRPPTREANSSEKKTIFPSVPFVHIQVNEVTISCWSKIRSQSFFLLFSKYSQPIRRPIEAVK